MYYSYGILASGSLGLNCLESIFNKRKIVFVFTDSKSEAIILFCNTNNIPLFVGNPRAGAAITFLKKFQVDTIISVNYLFIIENDIISFPEKWAINIHGSLLPKYRGRTPHVWAIINNECETGITAHLITEECDKGDIIYQEKILLDNEITGADVLNLFSKKYPIILDKVIEMIDSGEIVKSTQDENKASYFGKRSPEDGQIHWQWQKERIHNWVRAQAKPYPGSFTYYNNKKIVIHKISFSDHGFLASDINGLILEGGNKPIIKTPNGAIKLLVTETDEPIDFEKGKILHEKH